MPPERPARADSPAGVTLTRAGRRARRRRWRSRTSCGPDRVRLLARALPTPSRRSRRQPRPGARRVGRHRDRAARRQAPDGRRVGRPPVCRHRSLNARVDGGIAPIRLAPRSNRRSRRSRASPGRLRASARRARAWRDRCSRWLPRAPAPSGRDRRAFPFVAGTPERRARRPAAGRPPAPGPDRRPPMRARAAPADCRRSPCAVARR